MTFRVVSEITLTSHLLKVIFQLQTSWHHVRSFFRSNLIVFRLQMIPTLARSHRSPRRRPRPHPCQASIGFQSSRVFPEVERSLMVRWVVGSILHGVDPLSYFSFQPVLHDWCNKGRGMCYPVCGMVHIKEPLLLIDKSSLCGGSVFPFSLSEWSLTICLTPYNRR